MRTDTHCRTMSPDSENATSRRPSCVETSTRCAWCGAPLRPGPANGFVAELCRACGARTTQPEPTDAELELAYGSWYRPAEGRFAGLADAALGRLRAGLARRLDRIAPPGPVLDVGSGDGGLLDALASVGREALGLERRSARPDVKEAALEEIDGRFAAIVFWHSLEHLRGAGAALTRAAELLAPGGVLIIAMPNIASLQARAFGEHWFALDLPRHLVHVPADALFSRVRELGLEPIRISYLRGGQGVFGWLHGIVGSLPAHPDLYDAIRRPQAQQHPMSASERIATLAAGALALPAAAACALLEASLRRGGTVYLEARHG
jgi:hypothetical protein